MHLKKAKLYEPIQASIELMILLYWSFHNGLLKNANFDNRYGGPRDLCICLVIANHNTDLTAYF
jgi:hypothetical protein